MATTKELIEEYQKKRKKIEAMASADAIEKRHKEGQWTARERINYFFDKGTFNETGIFTTHRQHNFGMDKREVLAEGVVTGYGLVNGRPVVAFAEDYMAMAGSFGEYHGLKEIRAIKFAMEMGWPVVGMNDSGGARLQEGYDTLETYGQLFNTQIRASGIIPQIALLMGPCLGGQAYHPIMQDFLVQCRKTGFMGIAGPAIVETQLGEKISLEDLSGWKAHAVKSGQSHIVAEDDKDAIDKTKELLGLLPSNNMEWAPIVKTTDDPNRVCPELDTIIPDNPNRPYNMFNVIKSISDNGYFYEILKDHAKMVITGFAKFNGQTVGIWANQPMVAAGTIDINAADKGARFVRFCDLFNIPVVALGDCPGYLIGSDQDWKGILRHGAKLLFAWADASIPLISVMLRKSYAGAHYGMLDKGIGADLVFAWPTARITIVGAESAASVIFAREIRESANPAETRAKRIQEYSDLYENPYVAASRGCVDDVIMPSDTRKAIINALNILKDKDKDHRAFKARHWRKYSNINL
jgi:methylmalonyl-CoA decarboxylase subunit alpha